MQVSKDVIKEPLAILNDFKPTSPDEIHPRILIELSENCQDPCQLSLKTQRKLRDIR